MVTLKELEELVQKARRYRLKIRIKFKGIKYGVIIESEIKALDDAEKVVSWSKAFPLAPHQVLTNYPVESIQVECSNEIIWSGRSISDLLKSLDQLRC
ncbi:MAG: hypothetical protein RXO22_07335 [Thermocladium sp.]|jgi:hypothetical protein|nr:MAG: hypothetical protein AT710_01700 [Thermocladium sp. ECH_B]